MSFDDNYNLKLLYSLAGKSSYSCMASHVTPEHKFVPSFPKTIRPEFVPDPIMNHKFKWCHELDSNQPHTDFQSAALPDELPRHLTYQ